MKNNLDIAEIRSNLGLTQAELAELLNVDRKYVSMIETGSRPLSNKLAKKLDKLVSGDINAPRAIVTNGAIGHNNNVTTSDISQ